MASMGLNQVAPVCARPGSQRPHARDDYVPVVRRLSAGDRAALEVLYARFATPLFRYLLTLTPDRQVAEEILQDTFVAVWRGADTFAGRSTVQTWIFGIGRRQASKALRRLGLPLCDDYELDLLPTSEVQPEKAALLSAERNELVDQIARIRPLHREVLTLIFYCDLSYAEASKVLEVPVGTVKSRLSNAKRALRALLRASDRVQR